MEEVVKMALARDLEVMALRFILAVEGEVGKEWEAEKEKQREKRESEAKQNHSNRNYPE